MANYVITFVDPTGVELFSGAVELENVDGINQMTAFMMDNGDPNTVYKSVERAIPGGFDKRAPYRIRVEKRD